MNTNMRKDLETQIRALFSTKIRNGHKIPYLYYGKVYICTPVSFYSIPESMLCLATEFVLLILALNFLAVINISPH